MSKKNVYTCETCSALYVCLKYFQEHRKKHAIQEGRVIFPCTHCQTVNTSEYESHLHSMSHQNEPPHWLQRKRHPIPARLGPIVQANSMRLLIAIAICLAGLCLAIKSAQLEAQLSSWIQRSGRIQSELAFVESQLGEGAGSSGELILQSPKDPIANVLRVDALMVHLEALAIASHVTVDLFDIPWSLKDLCYTPTLPDFDFEASTILNRMMPCSIKSPLDCFWEGSKLLGPDEPVETLSAMGLSSSRWSSLNPLPMVEAMRRNQPHADFPYGSLIDWMRRVGMTSGYQLKPCLDPTDPNCPESAPNKLTGRPPDVGRELTGGCRGFAANQMHWKEEELVGGVMRNKSGQLVYASGLQSTIQLMGEQDLFEYWRQTDKVNRLNGWSVEKAKMVLELWQRRFKEELEQFTKTSGPSSAYKIHAMTSKSMLEPIQVDSLLNLGNILICFALMTFFTCIVFPDFAQFHNQQQGPSESSKSTTLANWTLIQVKKIPMALTNSLFVGLTLMASLGVSSFMSLPFNMATTWILPPLALHYAFSQFITISNIYSRKLSANLHRTHITTECLIESVPIVIMECFSYVIALSASTIFPVQATRVFAFQAIIFILMSSSTSLLVTPAILNTFLRVDAFNNLPDVQTLERVHAPAKSSSSPKPKMTRTASPISRFKLRSKRIDARQSSTNDSDLEEQILSRIQEDLKNIQADGIRQQQQQPTSLSFSAHMATDGVQTSFSFSTSQPRTSMIVSQPNLGNLKTEFTPERHCDSDRNDSFHLPDLVSDPLSRPANPSPDSVDSAFDEEVSIKGQKELADLDTPAPVENLKQPEIDFKSIEKLAPGLARIRLIQTLVCILALVMFTCAILQVPKVQYGLQLRDIVAKDTPEYESFLIQEKNFPVYNVFAITKGNFDYPNNQKLLHQFYENIKRTEGVLTDDDSTAPKFWLVAFRDWLQMLQQKFDDDRSKSLISVDGWTPHTSDAAKLAYKLLAQTGRVDNLIDKSLVTTNRLVDSNGIINPKAFYYYLTAWVVKDPFTYATSEANFRPEPNIWDHHHPDNLKIERARPLTYTQIPFQMKLPANHESLDRISSVRIVSQAFEQFNLPNFPTGVPFVFWDQFMNLDIYITSSLIAGIAFMFILIKLVTSDVRIAAITTIPATLTLFQSYAFLGYYSIPFNNILAVLLTSSIGITTLQSVHLTSYFLKHDGDLVGRTLLAIRSKFKTISTNIVLFLICALVFKISKYDFMIKYSSLLFCIALLSAFNSLLLVPVLLSLFGSDYVAPRVDDFHTSRNIEFSASSSRSKDDKKRHIYKKKKKKRRGHPIIQSKISLSTISEEAQSEAPTHDLKLDFSVKCY